METVTWSSRSENDEEIDEEGKSDIYLHGVPIPPQILAEILVRVDGRRDVGYICPLVCRRWYNVLSAPGFWISYMIYRSMDLPPSFLRNEPSLNVKKVSLQQAFGRNLISNPSGDDGYQNWEIYEDGGDEFEIEKPPVGCIALEEIPVAFVTSYDWCSKFQIIDLWKEGIEVVSIAHRFIYWKYNCFLMDLYLCHIEQCQDFFFILGILVFLNNMIDYSMVCHKMMKQPILQ
ncbi:F-box only protein 26, putative [Brugia malayi]|uniref:Bm2191, isoform b n=1 Tax=Brugia malayi TaxID=6279 RepID=A0A0K0J4V6_BRUMA|nr:F-box only protein 26, putative [Brugia malayi]CDP98987.1 Bm2191, isoform b [Brugia malayi]VIO99104.1 F-box only protein 26, putative [Brugia malayi]